MKSNFYHLFMKRFYKWMIILFCLICMLFPVIHASKKYARDIVQKNLVWDLQESIDRIERNINNAHQLMNLISVEESFQKLVKNKGELPVEQYVYLPRLQARLAQISVIFELDTMSYLVFRDTPVFISNKGCSDHYTELMPVPLAFMDSGGGESWHAYLFENAHNYQILSNTEFVNPDFTHSSEGIVFIINGMQNGIPNDKSRLVTVIDCSWIPDRLIHAGMDEDTFICILDQNDQVLYQYNVPEEGEPVLIREAGGIAINGERYQLFEESSELWELKIVCGMPDTAVEQRIQRTMDRWVFLYIGIGVCVVVVLSLVFSYRETRSIGSLIKTAARSADEEYTKDEYSFLSHAFEKLEQSNLEKQEEIEVLSHQIEAGILESLIMRGSYAAKEQSDFVKYLNGHFQFFCVTIFSFHTAGEGLRSLERQELYEATEGILRREALFPDYYSCFLVMDPEELVCVLSLPPDEPVALNRLRKRLLSAMKNLNGQLEQEELHITVCAGISKPAQDIANIRTAYLQAQNALSLEERTHSGEIYQYAPPRTQALKSTFESIKYQHCYDLLISGDKEGINAFFEELEKEINRMSQNDQETMQLFFTLREPIYNAYILIVSNEGAEEENPPVFPQYMTGYTVKQICSDYRSLCSFLCDTVETNRRNYNDAVHRRIIEYIQEYFTDPELTSLRVAEHFLVSEKYLYSVVKGESGKTFGKYVESLRMQKAEALLLTTEFTNVQIYQQCGYGSENTFYRNFLKVHGISPAVWKAKMREKTDPTS